MVRQAVVELGRDPPDLWQPRSRDVGEVVVLVVVAHVEGDRVQRAVVGVRLEALVEHVVLRDEVAGNRVEAHRHQRAADHVEQHLAAWMIKSRIDTSVLTIAVQTIIIVLAEEIEHDEIGGELHRRVDKLQLERLLRVGEERPEGVERRLQAHPDELAEGVAEQPRLQLRRDVSVDHVLPLVPVVLQVVALERDGERDPDRQVGEDAQEAVGQRTLHAETGVVRDLVDGCRYSNFDYILRILLRMYIRHGRGRISTQHESVINDAAEAVRRDDDHGPRPVSEEEQHEDLECDQGGHLVLEDRVDAEQLLDLRVLACNVKRVCVIERRACM